MKHSYSYPLVVLPLFLLSVLAFTLLVQRQGATYDVNSQYYKINQFLPSEVLEIKNYFPHQPTTTLVVYDSEIPYKEITELVENLIATLDSMRVKYDLYDINSTTRFDLSNYETLIITMLDLSKLNAQTSSMVDWVESGGRLFIALRPDNSPTTNLVFGKTGAIITSESWVVTRGIELLTDLLPGGRDDTLGKEFILNSAYTVDLDDNNCEIHIVSAENDKTPILWMCKTGNGRAVVINSDQFGTKDSRGLLGAAYRLLYDPFVYPVINSSTLYIDDFPAPLPEGSNELIKKFYNMENSRFFREVWWEDMRKIAEKYHVRFTVGMIETYEHNITAPLPKQLEQETHKYFGSAILSINGEVIFHGYNHVPFCKKEDNINALEGYPAWPNTENAQLSLVELYNFGADVFYDYRFWGYIPPSNILCQEARRWLPTVVPDIKYIASVYLPDLDGHEYLQEFAEASDGVIEFPRIVAGYDMVDDEYGRWAVMNELSLHYLNSHFVHPDDMLDMDRHAEKGWDNLRDQYADFIEWLQMSAPGLRNMTGSEGAMAVQRYYRLAVDTKVKANSLTIELGNFYDEAWLMMRSTRKPLSIEGGVITPVSSDEYLIQALDSIIIVIFEE